MENEKRELIRENIEIILYDLYDLKENESIDEIYRIIVLLENGDIEKVREYINERVEYEKRGEEICKELDEKNKR